MGFEPMHRTVTAFGLYHLATATPQQSRLVPRTGIEPACIAAPVSKTGVSANSTNGA
jgi:hypothetical protein